MKNLRSGNFCGPGRGASGEGGGRPVARDDAFLGVAASVCGNFWCKPAGHVERTGLAIAQRTGLPDLLCRVLAARNVTPETALAWLEPTLRALMPDPDRLEDMAKGVALFASMVRARARIAVFADYDVDGAAGAALLIGWLREIGHDGTLYVPDRVEEGYGPNEKAMGALAGDHALIVCVDCGVNAHAPIARAVEGGASVIVLDHHMAGETLPPADAVIDPNRQDDESGLGNLCAGGVVFMFLVALNRFMRREGLFDASGAPDLLSRLDLVALATVADMVALTGLNRAFVRQGLAVMHRRGRIGLQTLADIARLHGAPDEGHLGFLFGPRINAGGRIGEPSLGAQLLLARDGEEAARIANILERLNRERQNREVEITEAALAQVEGRGIDEEAPLVWAIGENWHPGVLGLVAARLKARFRRPALAMTRLGGKVTGSARSIEGVNLGRAVLKCVSEGAFVKGGGHGMAAGLTIEPARLGDALARFADALRAEGAAGYSQERLRFDAALSASGATRELCELLKRAGPYGMGAPAPRFALPHARIAWRRRVGVSHLRLSLADSVGGRLEAVAFRAFESMLGAFLMKQERAHVAGRLGLNEWNGRRHPQFVVDDAAPSHD